jgi:hypothetical protein
MYLKRAMKGRIDLMKPAMHVQKELMSIPEFGEVGDEYDTAFNAIQSFKKAILMCAGAAVQKLMSKLNEEQEILMSLADMLNDTFQAESMWLRCKKMQDMNHGQAVLALDALRVFISDAGDRIHHSGKHAINAFASGDEQRMLLLGIKRFTKTESFNAKEARRRIAGKVIGMTG